MKNVDDFAWHAEARNKNTSTTFDDALNIFFQLTRNGG